MQYADLGYNEVDGSEEWDNDYPNPITYIPPDQTLTNPGIVTTQFDNVLNAVRGPCGVARALAVGLGPIVQSEDPSSCRWFLW